MGRWSLSAAIIESSLRLKLLVAQVLSEALSADCPKLLWGAPSVAHPGNSPESLAINIRCSQVSQLATLPLHLYAIAIGKHVSPGDPLGRARCVDKQAVL